VVFNAVTIVVVYVAIRRGETMGALAGTLCGLAQDAFSLNVFGVAGLTKTLLGYWTGSISRRIDVAQPARNALFLLIMSVLETILWVLLTGLVRWRAVNVEGGLLFVQPVVTAVLAGGLLAVERGLERRRSRGA
jgi:rod shape-determining protein MreD